MKIHRSVYAMAASAALAVSALAASGAAQARDVAWSIGVAAPGVQLGVSNAPQVYRQSKYVPQTYYYSQPQVVYSQPQVIYTQPQVVYAQPQVVYTPQSYYVGTPYIPPVYYRDWGPRHGHDGRRDHHGRR